MGYLADRRARKAAEKAEAAALKQVRTLLEKSGREVRGMGPHLAGMQQHLEEAGKRRDAVVEEIRKDFEQITDVFETVKIIEGELQDIDKLMMSQAALEARVKQIASHRISMADQLAIEGKKTVSDEATMAKLRSLENKHKLDIAKLKKLHERESAGIASALAALFRLKQSLDVVINHHDDLKQMLEAEQAHGRQMVPLIKQAVKDAETAWRNTNPEP